jgi:hypothetical protein
MWWPLDAEQPMDACEPHEPDRLVAFRFEPLPRNRVGLK